MSVTPTCSVSWLRALPLALLASCAAATPTDGPVRSPSQDYANPNNPTRTSDGAVLGADGKAPDTLMEEQGTSDRAAPGWNVDEHGVSYDPKRPAGHSDQAAVPERKPENKGSSIPGAKAPP